MGFMSGRYTRRVRLAVAVAVLAFTLTASADAQTWPQTVDGYPGFHDPYIDKRAGSWFEGHCSEQSDGSLVSTSEPMLNFYNTTGWQDGTFSRNFEWQLALDVANSCNGDLVIAKGRPIGVSDFIYLRDEGGLMMGVNLTPPQPGHVFQVGVPNGSPWGAIKVRFGKSTGGPAIEVVRASGRSVWKLDYGGRIHFPRGGMLEEGPNGGLVWVSKNGRRTRIAPP